jgi:hydrogenase maturation factor HypF (carbamoyltransferase family)
VTNSQITCLVVNRRSGRRGRKRLRRAGEGHEQEPADNTARPKFEEVADADVGAVAHAEHELDFGFGRRAHASTSFGDGAALVRAAHDDLAAGRPCAEIAAAFHEAVAAASAALCAEVGEPRIVALSGGTFQNLRLLASTRSRLEREGFCVISHRLVPPNDRGISYGQAAVAAAGPLRDPQAYLP